MKYCVSFVKTSGGQIVSTDRCTGAGVHVAGERIRGTKSTSELDGWDGSAWRYVSTGSLSVRRC